MKARSLAVGLVTSAACVLASIVGAGSVSADVMPFIVGGSDADQEYSFMVSLQNGGEHFCGGSLVDSDWVLTSAQCVENESADSISVRVGSNDRTQGGEVAQAAEILIHKDFKERFVGGDIALVKLASPVQVTPVPVGSAGDVGTKARMLGWGQTCPEHRACPAPVQLQQLDTQVVDNDKCSGDDPYRDLCVDNPGGDSGFCYGDAGGPLMVNAGGSWELIGVSSRNYLRERTCGTKPSIATPTKRYVSWISEKTGA